MYLFAFRGLLIGIFSSLLYPFFALFILWLLPSELKSQYLAVLSVLSLGASLLLFRRWRTLKDTATSTLRTVSQGYTELIGSAMTFPGETGPGPFHLPPVVWFSTPNQTSSQPFLVNDEFGSCTIDPQQAEIITPLHYRSQQSFRAIFPGQTVYVLGQLTTISGHKTDLEKREAVLGLLGTWKKDQYEMLRRFDTNGDGKIDSQELLVARDAAEHTIDDHLDYEYQQAATHLVDKPKDGRPFILSSIPLDDLLKRYSIMMFAHLVAWPLFGVLALISTK